jgi:two-component system NtrC family sensor kinase
VYADVFETKISLLQEDYSFSTFKKSNKTYSRAFIRIQNKKQCFRCHSREIANLAYVVFDFSLNQTQKNINFTRKFSISFTIFMVLILGAFVLIMHYRFVKSGLSSFRKSIDIINKGDISERVPIAKSKELGELAKQFNIMMDNFQETSKQLNEYHEKELQDAQKLATIGEMSARLAHEIRNPITGIANAIEVFSETVEDEQDKSILEEIKRQAKRVNDAVTKLLKYSKSQDLNAENNNMNEVIQSIVFFLKNQSGSERITYILDLDSKLPEVKFDREQTEIALMNISLNAIQAIFGKGSITYKTSFDDQANMLFIEISDTGSGISEENINKIFKPFYTTKTEGTGLGMSIIKETIEKHNGKIKVKSKINEGTTFIITLPGNNTSD